MLRYSWFHRAWLLIAAMACAGLCASSAAAAGGPQIAASWVTEVSMNPSNPSAALRAQINPNELSTTYRFDYITEAAYQANVQASPPRDGFTGAAKVPPGSGPSIGSGTVPVSVLQRPAGLAPTTVYRYRAVAVNSAGTTPGPARRFETQEATPAFHLADNRGWEMVSPVDKNGGLDPGTRADLRRRRLPGRGQRRSAHLLLRRLVRRRGAGRARRQPVPRPPRRCRLGTREHHDAAALRQLRRPLRTASPTSSSPPILLAACSPTANAAAAQAGGNARSPTRRCRAPVRRPAIATTTCAPAAPAALQSLLGSAELNYTALGADAVRTEVRRRVPRPRPRRPLQLRRAHRRRDRSRRADGGCDRRRAQNLYEWSGSGLSLVNLLPGDTQGTPGAAIGAQAGAVSSDGTRVYWVSELEDGTLYLREGRPTKLLPGTAGGGAAFQTASSDGRVRLLHQRAGISYRYDASSGIATDLTPAGGVLGVLGASDDGSTSTTRAASASSSGTTAPPPKSSPANAAAPSNYPPSTGTARVSADGSHLAFVSSCRTDRLREPRRQRGLPLRLPSAGGDPSSTCVSCKPTGERPAGAGTIPGAIANGEGAGATRFYKPRALSADGTRVFFDSDRLAGAPGHRQPPRRLRVGGGGGGRAAPAKAAAST